MANMVELCGWLENYLLFSDTLECFAEKLIFNIIIFIFSFKYFLKIQLIKIEAISITYYTIIIHCKLSTI